MVKPGYKRTEVGVIPEEWSATTLGAIGSTYGGLTGKSKRDFIEGNARYIPFLNVMNNVQIDVQDLSYVHISRTETQNRVMDGDLLFNGSSETPDEVGMCSVLMEDVGELYLNSFCFGFRFRDNLRVEGLFLAYLFRSDVGRELLRTLAQGATRYNLSKSNLLKLTLYLPAYEEQRAIAAALSDVDDLIASLDKLIAKKQAVKTAVMQDLLTGRRRLPGFEGEWEVITLNALADKTDQWSITGGPFGSDLKSSDYTASGVRVIQLQNIGDGKFLDSYKVYTSLDKANELRACNIFPGEIILSKMGDPVARACLVPDTESRYLMCSDGIRLKLDSRYYDTNFVHAYLNSASFRSQAVEASTGTTRQRIGLTELKSLTLRIPSLNEQEAIGGVLSDIDAEITALQTRRDKTTAIKQGMMQELLTGRVRLV